MFGYSPASDAVPWFTLLPGMGLCLLALICWNMLINNSTTSSTTLKSCLANSKGFLSPVEEKLWKACWFCSPWRPSASGCSEATLWTHSKKILTQLFTQAAAVGLKILKDFTEEERHKLREALGEEQLCRLEWSLWENEWKGFIVSRASQKQLPKSYLAQIASQKLPVSVSWLLR